MSNLTIVLLIILAVVAVFVAICLIIPRLIRKGINLSGIIAGAGDVLDTADVVLDGVQKFIPDNPGVCIADKIIDYAKEAVKAAEQMYKASQIEAEARNAEAKSLIEKCLVASGVEISNEVQQIIDAAIEAAVFTLPKTHTNE